MASGNRDGERRSGARDGRRVYRVVGPNLEGTVLTVGRPGRPADLAVIVRVPAPLRAFRNAPLRALAAYCAGKGLFLAPVEVPDGADGHPDPA